MSEFAAFLTATQRCISQCKAMLEFEQEKRQALLADDLDRLEHMISAQQAAIMRLESLEKQRLDAQEKAGYSQLSAEEILEQLSDGPEKTSLAEHVRELKQTLEEIRYHNGRAVEIARANLQVINTLATGKEQKEPQGVYRLRPGAGANWQSSSSFDTKL